MFNFILLCFLTCCSSLMPLKQSESILSEDHTQVVEAKSRYNAVTYGGYSLCTFADICNFDYLLYNYDGSGFFTATNQGTIKTAYELTNADKVRFIGWGDINVSANDLGFSSGLPVTNAYFSLVAIGFQNSMRYQTWDFYSTINGVTRFIRFDIFYNTSSSNSIEGVSCITQINPPFDFILIFDNSYKFLYDPIIGSDYQNGYSQGERIGYNTGYNDGYDVGYDEGEERGKEIALDPASEIYDLIFNAGYQSGYQNGIDDSIAAGTEAATIFSGIMDVAFIPVNVFFLMFNYEVFGINIAGFVSGLLTIAIVLIIFKFILGRKI